MSNAESTPPKSTESSPIPKLLVDADVLVAGAFSTTGASHLILRLGEFSILRCVAPVQVREEAERNVRYKMPDAFDTFRTLVDHALEIFPDPFIDDVNRFANQAHPEDVSILASAVLSNSQYLVTFNTRHYHPDDSLGLTVITPGKFIERLRLAVSALISTR